MHQQQLWNEYQRAERRMMEEDEKRRKKLSKNWKSSEDLASKVIDQQKDNFLRHNHIL